MNTDKFQGNRDQLLRFAAFPSPTDVVIGTHAGAAGSHCGLCTDLPTCCSRAIYFLSRASAAANFRSTCGSKRGPPECRTHRSPIPTPQVGQGTEEACRVV